MPVIRLWMREAVSTKTDSRWTLVSSELQVRYGC